MAHGRPGLGPNLHHPALPVNGFELSFLVKRYRAWGELGISAFFFKCTAGFCLSCAAPYIHMSWRSVGVLQSQG